MILLPDWIVKLFATEFQKEINPDFVFKGPGLYIRETEFDLVLPVLPSDGWEGKANGLYYVHHYGCPLSETVFGQSIPTRVDER